MTEKGKRPAPTSFELDPVIEAYKKDIDFSLIDENLRLTIEQRFIKLMALQRLADELNGCRRRGETGT